MAKSRSKPKVTCTCGCGRYVTRKTVAHHLGGKGAKDVIIAQQRLLLKQRNQQGAHFSGPRQSSPCVTPTRGLPIPSSYPPTPEDVDGDTLMNQFENTSDYRAAGPMPVYPQYVNTSSSDEEADSDSDGPDDAWGTDWIAGKGSDEDGSDPAADELPTAPWLQGLSAEEILAEGFEIEAATRGYRLSKDDLDCIRAHNYKVNTLLGSQSYEKIPRAFPQLSGLLSTQRLRSRISFLSGVKPVHYHCCVNSCCCFTGAYESVDCCPYCEEPRYNSNGKPRNTFAYLPLIPRLINFFLDEETANAMDYRHNYQHTPGRVADVFDGEHYRKLRSTNVTIDGHDTGHKFFSQPTDIAIGLSTDGFCPFKRRKQTCWPILCFNYNLPPEVRFHLNNLICLGVVPGPRQPKELDSFLVPFVEECLELERGVPAFDKRHMHAFLLCVYLILVFGDMPAIAKLMRMKGPNGFSPCRACTIHGVENRGSPGHTHYTPLHRSSAPSYDPLRLPLRDHNQFVRQATQVVEAPTDTEERRRAKTFGINGVPALVRLSSLRFPISFPHDFMHLVLENVLQTVVKACSGDYKGLDSGNEDYIIADSAWKAIGEACSRSGDTIPSAFGCRIPNIATERHYFIAESWLLFATLLGPTLLRRRFSRPTYYQHFVLLVKLINHCLQMELTSSDINEIKQGFAKWVLDYERFYYQYSDHRLPFCTLPVHALLHLADDIRNMGPVWCYWVFSMERFAGVLVPAVKSRQRPYASLANYVCDIAQLSQIKVIYGLSRELDLGDRRDMERNGTHYDGYPQFVMVRPFCNTRIDLTLRRKIAAHLATNYATTSSNALGFVPSVVNEWGKLLILDGGDLIGSRGLGSQHGLGRDKTFVKYILEVDRNRCHRNRPVILEEQTYYGQVAHLIALQFSPTCPLAQTNPDHPGRPMTLVLAAIASIKPVSFNEFGMPSYVELGPIEVVDASVIQCVVGRIYDRRVWTIIDRAAVIQKFNATAAT